MTVPVDAYGRAVVTDDAPRCWKCNRLLAFYVTRPWMILCTRCKAKNKGGDAPDGG